ncbi:GNAT family protein [Solibacillus sp. CAU 1738]|uniref:GNAT family N-acetyltransferase n=1 Tax=Solibacillus sp. CAU 1738 TaxID=3140363 RepID=UPI00325FED6A
MFTFLVDNEISIELLQQQHRAELYELIDINREHLRQWLLWVDKRKCADDLQPIIKMWLEKYAENNGFDAGIRHNGNLVGMIGLHYIDWKNKSTSIGYFLAENAQGKGIITKSISNLMEYLFERLDLNRIEIQCAMNNVKSKAIPVRLGFINEGVIREGQWLYDHYEDIVTYSLLKKDWEDKRIVKKLSI